MAEASAWFALALCHLDGFYIRDARIPRFQFNAATRRQRAMAMRVIKIDIFSHTEGLAAVDKQGCR
jgi:hypothetical protein